MGCTVTVVANCCQVLVPTLVEKTSPLPSDGACHQESSDGGCHRVSGGCSGAGVCYRELRGVAHYKAVKDWNKSMTPPVREETEATTRSALPPSDKPNSTTPQVRQDVSPYEQLDTLASALAHLLIRSQSCEDIALKNKDREGDDHCDIPLLDLHESELTEEGNEEEEDEKEKADAATYRPCKTRARSLSSPSSSSSSSAYDIPLTFTWDDESIRASEGRIRGTKNWSALATHQTIQPRLPLRILDKIRSGQPDSARNLSMAETKELVDRHLLLDIEHVDESSMPDAGPSPAHHQSLLSEVSANLETDSEDSTGNNDTKSETLWITQLINQLPDAVARIEPPTTGLWSTAMTRTEQGWQSNATHVVYPHHPHPPTQMPPFLPVVPLTQAASVEYGAHNYYYYPPHVLAVPGTLSNTATVSLHSSVHPLPSLPSCVTHPHVTHPQVTHCHSSSQLSIPPSSYISTNSHVGACAQPSAATTTLATAFSHHTAPAFCCSSNTNGAALSTMHYSLHSHHHLQQLASRPSHLVVAHRRPRGRATNDALWFGVYRKRTTSPHTARQWRFSPRAKNIADSTPVPRSTLVSHSTSSSSQFASPYRV